jgi:hypothetical protein
MQEKWAKQSSATPSIAMDPHRLRRDGAPCICIRFRIGEEGCGGPFNVFRQGLDCAFGVTGDGEFGDVPVMGQPLLTQGPATAGVPKPRS